MASASNQAEIYRSDVGHRYGDITVYGNALLGDGNMTVQQAPVDPQEQKRQGTRRSHSSIGEMSRLTASSID